MQGPCASRFRTTPSDSRAPEMVQGGATCLLTALDKGEGENGALRERRLDIIRALIEAGADVNATYTGVG